MGVGISRLSSVHSCSIWLFSASRWLLSPLAVRQTCNANQLPLLLVNNLENESEENFIQILGLCSIDQHCMLCQNSYLHKQLGKQRIPGWALLLTKVGSIDKRRLSFATIFSISKEVLIIVIAYWFFELPLA